MFNKCGHTYGSILLSACALRFCHLVWNASKWAFWIEEEEEKTLYVLCCALELIATVCLFVHSFCPSGLFTHIHELFRFVFFSCRRMLAINLKISIRLLSNYVKLYCIPFSFPLCSLLLFFFVLLVRLVTSCSYANVLTSLILLLLLLHQKESENNKPRLRKRDSFFLLLFCSCVSRTERTLLKSLSWLLQAHHKKKT